MELLDFIHEVKVLVVLYLPFSFHFSLYCLFLNSFSSIAALLVLNPGFSCRVDVVSHFCSLRVSPHLKGPGSLKQ